MPIHVHVLSAMLISAFGCQRRAVDERDVALRRRIRAHELPSIGQPLRGGELDRLVAGVVDRVVVDQLRTLERRSAVGRRIVPVGEGRTRVVRRVGVAVRAGIGARDRNVERRIGPQRIQVPVARCSFSEYTPPTRTAICDVSWRSKARSTLRRSEYARPGSGTRSTASRPTGSPDRSGPD